MTSPTIDAAPVMDAGSRRARLAFCLLASVVTAAALTVLAPSLLQDPDSWWHLRSGLDMLANRSFPTVDAYSHTFEGQPWIAKEWLGQILLALAYSAAGWNGVVTLIIATIALTTFLMAWFLSEWLKPIVAIALTLVAIQLINPIFTSRPNVFTLPIALTWTVLLYRAAREERAPSFWMLPLLVLWANLHATFTFGFIIAAFAWLDFMARSGFSRRKELVRWIVFGLLCPLVTLVHPYGVKAILATFTVASGNEAVPMIGEWVAFDASAQPVQEVVLLLAIFGLMVSGLRIGWAKALFILFALHLYLTHLRFVFFVFLLVPAILAAELAVQYPALSARSWLAEKRDGLERLFARRFVPIVAGGGALVLTAALALGFTFRIAPAQDVSAEDAIAFARANGISGKVLNSYNFGGTLVFHGIKTFIDGRNDQLFLGGFTQADDDMGRSGGKPLLEASLAKYDIGWALLGSNDPRVPFFQELGWNRVYADPSAVIFTRPQ